MQCKCCQPLSPICDCSWNIGCGVVISARHQRSYSKAPERGIQWPIGATPSSDLGRGKGAIKWTRLPCRTFAANAARLQLHALAYNLGNFLHTLATPKPIKDCVGSRP